MRRLVAIVILCCLQLGARAQLEVKPDSFKEVPGFVNINLEIQADDNDVPYAVVKVKTENISDKQRRELLFQGDAATFVECEYKVGEVWVYLTFKASYLKISHPDLSSTEFWFPFDMKPKCGYELTLVNNATITDEELQKRIKQLEAELQNKPEPQIVYVEKPAEQKQQKKEVKLARPKESTTPRYSFITFDASKNTYNKPAVGFTIGSMRKVGVFLTMMTDFNFNHLGDEEFNEHHDKEWIQNYAETNDCYTYSSYVSFSVIGGIIFKVYGPLNLKIGGGYSNNSEWINVTDRRSIDNDFWVSDVSSYGFGGLVGLQINYGKIVVSISGATTNFKIYEGRIGLGYGLHGKL
ncbi:MAG: hypothetical protein J6X10_06240 [Bacteroidales bacterium]|nr:hypothetical protein [Bacteroidales bacterium]